MSLKNLVVGGELSKKSFLYRFLVFWFGRERVDAITDSCQLRLLLLRTAIGMLFLGTLALVCVFGLGFAIVESVREGTIAISLAMIFIVAGIIALIYATPKLEKRWPRLTKWSNYVAIAIFTIAATVFVIVLIALFALMIGGEIYLRSGIGGTDLLEGLIGFVTLLLGGAALFGILAVIVKIIWLIIDTKRCLARTQFWLWVKGKLCFPITIVNS